MPPLWAPELPATENHIELGFRDLIELRFIKAFMDLGLHLSIEALAGTVEGGAMFELPMTSSRIGQLKP